MNIHHPIMMLLPKQPAGRLASPAAAAAASAAVDCAIPCGWASPTGEAPRLAPALHSRLYGPKWQTPDMTLHAACIDWQLHKTAPTHGATGTWAPVQTIVIELGSNPARNHYSQPDATLQIGSTRNCAEHARRIRSATMWHTVDVMQLHTRARAQHGSMMLQAPGAPGPGFIMNRLLIKGVLRMV
jgi:hypothetical protein